MSRQFFNHLTANAHRETRKKGEFVLPGFEKLVKPFRPKTAAEAVEEFLTSKPLSWARIVAGLSACLLLALLDHAHATSEHDYKPGEFLVIKGGKSPDKQFSIVSGEDKAGKFGVYLMAAQTKKIIGPLEEVATGLDTAPDAYYAHWSADSKHVGIASRSDRHWTENIIYRIEDRRAYLVETPKLMSSAVPDFCRLEKELGGALTEDEINAAYGVTKPWKVRQISSYSEVFKWISPTRFVISEKSQFQVKARDPSSALGQYAEVEKAREGDDPADCYYVWFSAAGECELLPGDKSRVVNTRPSKDKDGKE